MEENPDYILLASYIANANSFFIELKNKELLNNEMQTKADKIQKNLYKIRRYFIDKKLNENG